MIFLYFYRVVRCGGKFEQLFWIDWIKISTLKTIYYFLANLQCVWMDWHNCRGKIRKKTLEFWKTKSWATEECTYILNGWKQRIEISIFTFPNGRQIVNSCRCSQLCDELTFTSLVPQKQICCRVPVTKNPKILIVNATKETAVMKKGATKLNDQSVVQILQDRQRIEDFW